MGEVLCDTALGLGTGHGGSKSGKSRRHETEPPMVRLHLWFPSSGKEEEEEKTPSMGSENVEKFPEKKNKSEQDNNRHDARKKLRLSPEQSTRLEDSFRAHNSLTSLEKEDLAFKLGLRPRQVEVWFQNRRARTKLKQTEVDCEVLKGWCESLSDENRRLRKEVQELRLYSKVSKVESTGVCPSCEGIMAEEEKLGGSDLGGKKDRNLQLCS